MREVGRRALRRKMREVGSMNEKLCGSRGHGGVHEGVGRASKGVDGRGKYMHLQGLK
jgi:hypothetical protein